MKFKRSVLAPVLMIGVVLGLSGCGTMTPTQQQRVESSVKVAAFVGTSEALRAHPDYRAGFELARDQLKGLEAAETIDATQLMVIVQRLPVKELKSERATLIITAATVLLSDYAGSIPLDRLQELKPVAKAIREGIELGLGGAPGSP